MDNENELYDLLADIEISDETKEAIKALLKDNMLRNEKLNVGIKNIINTMVLTPEQGILIKKKIREWSVKDILKD